MSDHKYSILPKGYVPNWKESLEVNVPNDLFTLNLFISWRRLSSSDLHNCSSSFPLLFTHVGGGFFRLWLTYATVIWSGMCSKKWELMSTKIWIHLLNLCRSNDLSTEMIFMSKICLKIEINYCKNWKLTFIKLRHKKIFQEYLQHKIYFLFHESIPSDWKYMYFCNFGGILQNFYRI